MDNVYVYTRTMGHHIVNTGNFKKKANLFQK